MHTCSSAVQSLGADDKGAEGNGHDHIVHVKNAVFLFINVLRILLTFSIRQHSGCYEVSNVTVSYAELAVPNLSH